MPRRRPPQPEPYPGDPPRSKKRKNPVSKEDYTRRSWLQGRPAQAVAARTRMPLEWVEGIYAQLNAEAQRFSRVDRKTELYRLFLESKERSGQHRGALKHFRTSKAFDLAQGALKEMRTEAALRKELIEDMAPAATAPAAVPGGGSGGESLLSAQLREIRATATRRGTSDLQKLSGSLLRAKHEGFDMETGDE